MLALVKAQAEPGLWLEEVAEPEIGINDVLIRVHKTGICGTDLHIHSWDDWAQRTIQVPMVVGNEFVGHVVCGRCRNCMAGRRNLCAHTIGLGVNRPGAFAELVALPMTNIWHHRPGIDEDVASIFDPFGNAMHTALAFPVLGEDVLVTGAGPIGCSGDGDRPLRGCAPRRGHGPQPVPAGACDADGCNARGRPAGARPRRRAARVGDERGLRRRTRDVGQYRGVERERREHGARRPSGCARDSVRGDPHRPRARGLQHADDQGHLRPARCSRPGTRCPS